MIPEIRMSNEKKLVGKRLSMSHTHNRVTELWRSFTPRRSEIRNHLNNDLISLAVYLPEYFLDFNPSNPFERWAAIEVTDFDHVPERMETFTVPAGLYAVFSYRGSSKDTSVFRYIFETWLPASAYLLDDRPHFEVLGAKYRNNDPASEEEIWIPVRRKISNKTFAGKDYEKDSRKG